MWRTRALEWWKRWAITSLCAAAIATALDAALLQRTRAYFTGGFLAADPARCERIVGIGFGAAAVVALLLALGSFAAWMVPVLFGAMGFASGIAAPSRDLLVKRSTPDKLE